MIKIEGKKIEIGRIAGAVPKVAGMLRYVAEDGEDLVIVAQEREKMSPEEKAQKEAERKAVAKKLQEAKKPYREAMQNIQKEVAEEYKVSAKERRLPSESLLEKEQKAKDLYMKAKNCKTVEEVKQLVA